MVDIRKISDQQQGTRWEFLTPQGNIKLNQDLLEKSEINEAGLSRREKNLQQIGLELKK